MNWKGGSLGATLGILFGGCCLLPWMDDTFEPNLGDGYYPALVILPSPLVGGLVGAGVEILALATQLGQNDAPWRRTVTGLVIMALVGIFLLAGLVLHSWNQMRRWTPNPPIVSPMTSPPTK